MALVVKPVIVMGGAMVMLANRAGLPGLVGTEHIGFTVPNIEAATRFFVDVIGCEHVYSLGPF